MISFSKPKLSLSTLILLLIIILGLSLRILGQNLYPQSLNLDEIAIGLNARFIAQTGQDEYGTFFPLAFRSHDDYKAPLYIYLTALLAKIFPLTNLTIRAISILSGTLTIYLVYVLANRIFTHSLRPAPHLAALLLAISPWHIQFSRAGYETTLALALVLTGTVTFIKASTKPAWIFISALSFAASIYAYHSTKVFVPLIILVLIFLTRHKLPIFSKTTFTAGLLLFTICLPIFLFSLTPAGQLRFKGTNIFSTPTLVDLHNNFRQSLVSQGHTLQATTFHNSKFWALHTLAQAYFTHFSYDFLFGTNEGFPKHHSPGTGLLYLWELPFLLIGIIALPRLKSNLKWLLVSWALFSPLAASLTWDIPSSVRTLIILPLPQLLTALGLIVFLKQLSSNFKRPAVLIISFVATYFLANYLHHYFLIAPKINFQAWQYGYQEAVAYSANQANQYQHIHVSTNLRQPQNFWAYYSNYDPSTYIKIDGGTVSGGFAETRNAFGPFFFKPIDGSQLNQDTLYIDLYENIPTNSTIIHTILDPNNQPIIGLFTN